MPGPALAVDVLVFLGVVILLAGVALRAGIIVGRRIDARSERPDEDEEDR